AVRAGRDVLRFSPREVHVNVFAVASFVRSLEVGREPARGRDPGVDGGATASAGHRANRSGLRGDNGFVVFESAQVHRDFPLGFSSDVAGNLLQDASALGVARQHQVFGRTLEVAGDIAAAA